jgi:hypothetical protein
VEGPSTRSRPVDESVPVNGLSPDLLLFQSLDELPTYITPLEDPKMADPRSSNDGTWGGGILTNLVPPPRTFRASLMTRKMEGIHGGGIPLLFNFE